MSDKYYYCLKHHTVEGEEGCRAVDRMGPYDSAAQASRALEIAAERTATWDNDPDWNDEASGSGGADKTEPDKDSD